MVKQAAAEPWKVIYEFTYACITQKGYKCNYWGSGGVLKELKLGVRGVKMTLEYLWNALFKLQYQTFLHPSLAFTVIWINILKKIISQILMPICSTTTRI